MSRGKRIQIAEDTLAILKDGKYCANKGTHDIKRMIKDSVAGTKLYSPEDFGKMPKKKNFFNTNFEVTGEKTFDATRRLSKEKVIALNFASAKKPGGGFINGATAQEEDLALASSLYSSLLPVTEFYERNQKSNSALYTDNMIYSPNVVVFRDEYLKLLPEPYTVSIITSPAVNVGYLKPEDKALAEKVMIERIRKLLLLCEHLGYETLVLGAWGCGVFGNDPKDIAAYFAKFLLNDGEFAKSFNRVVFAIYSKEDRFIRPFRDVFGK